MAFLLLYRTGFAPTNGSSVQVQRILTGIEDQFVHALWDPAEAGKDSIERRMVCAEAAVSLPSSCLKGRLLRKLNYWKQAARIRWLARGKRIKAAWVVCMMERDARRVSALLRAAGNPPYVLHVMDLLDAKVTPEGSLDFVPLIRNARRVLCISEPIEREVRELGAKSTELMRFCSDYSPVPSRRWLQPLRVALVGTLWKDLGSKMMDLLEAAWPEIDASGLSLEFHYAGKTFDVLPEVTRSRVVNHGLLSTTDCRKLLDKCHAAILPVSHPASSAARFSLPSRLADYFACGLPTVMSVERNTAVGEYIESLSGSFVRNVHGSKQLVAALHDLLGDASRWDTVSREASRYAAKNLSVDAVRQQVLRSLEAAATD